jgi:hypothetical protein
MNEEVKVADLRGGGMGVGIGCLFGEDNCLFV